MYGTTLPATGAAAITLFGVSLNGMWLGFALVTLGAILFALGRIVPKKRV